MILSTHGMVGGAIGAVSGSLPVAIIAGFISHFVLDSIPHWDYPIHEMEKKENPLDTKIGDTLPKKTIFIVGADAVIGLVVPVLISSFLGLSVLHTFLAAGFAMSPDFMQFVYYKTHARILIPFMKIHNGIHAELRLDNRPVLGISTQLMFWVVTIVAFVHI